MKLTRDYVVKNEGSLGRRRAVIQAILEYLIRNPDAKDTSEGVRRWWLPAGQGEWGKDEVQKALHFLTLKGWLRSRQTKQSEEIYSVNKDRMEEIRKFLSG